MEWVILVRGRKGRWRRLRFANDEAAAVTGAKGAAREGYNAGIRQPDGFVWQVNRAGEKIEPLQQPSTKNLLRRGRYSE